MTHFFFDGWPAYAPHVFIAASIVAVIGTLIRDHRNRKDTP